MKNIARVLRSDWMEGGKGSWVGFLAYKERKVGLERCEIKWRPWYDGEAVWNEDEKDSKNASCIWSVE